MASERNWAAIPARPFTANGGVPPGNAGQVTLADTIDFRVKQQVIITATGQPSLEVEVKAVQSDTVLFVGPSGNISLRSDLTLYTLASNAQIFSLVQPRPSIPEKEYSRAVFEEEPVVAIRSILVDDFGNKYNPSNPLPISLLSGFSLPPFDDVQKVLDPNDLPLSFKFFKSLVQVAQIDVTYNVNGTSTEFKRSL